MASMLLEGTEEEVPDRQGLSAIRSKTALPALVGPSGRGRSALLRIVGGLERSTGAASLAAPET